MQKTAYCEGNVMPDNSPVFNQILRVMRLTTFLLLVMCLHVSASTFSQSITYSGKEIPLEKIFSTIEQQTGYVVFYNKKLLEGAKTVTLSVDKIPLAEFLQLLLKDRPLQYLIEKESILISHKAQPAAVLPFSYLVSGTVLDSSGIPLSGASVKIKGKEDKKGTLTDGSGKFMLDAEDGDILVISFIGYAEISLLVKDGIIASKYSGAGQLVKTANNSLLIKLSATQTALKEIVVNKGYYATSKELSTGSVSLVTAEVMEKQPVLNPLEALYGRMTGVFLRQQAGSPGAPVTVQIRGLNSLRGDGNSPFYIVDGVPYTFQTLSSPGISSGIFSSGASPLNAINPSDLESIEVLKDADATAIYGSRGSNGVVLITTKKGKPGKTKLDVNVYTGITRMSRKMKMLNTAQYLEMRREALANDGITTPGPGDHDLNGNWDQNRYTDWQDYLIGRNPQSTNAQVSLSGGNAQTSFLVSGSYMKQRSVSPGNNGYHKLSTHFSLNHVSVNQKLQVNVSMSFVSDKNTQPYTDFTRGIDLAPNAPAVFKEDGSLNWANSTWENPMRELMATTDFRNNNLMMNATFSYELLQGLQLKTNLGFNYAQAKDFRAIPPTYFDPAEGRTAATAHSTFNNANRNSWIAEPQLSWSKNIGAGKLEILAGTTFQQELRERVEMDAIGFPSIDLMRNARAAARMGVNTDQYTDYRYTGAFGRIGYSLQRKYVLNITGRRDGSSRFGPGKQFGNFGAVGLAWLFHKEAFVQNTLPFLSFGKLRTSYGTTGNDQIGDYQFLDTYSSGLMYQNTSGLQPTRLFNADFAWEMNKKLEIGLELGFVKDRIMLLVNYYRNRCSNQLLNYSLPQTTGFTGIATNLGATVQNTGLEVEINTTNIKTTSLQWTSSLNFTVPKNKLIAFPGLATSTYANSYIIGRPIFLSRHYHYTGLNTQTGLYTFEDVNKDGFVTSTDDRQSLKEITQRYYGGFNNTINYKRWQLDVFFQFAKQLGFSDLFNNAGPGTRYNQPAEVMGRWRKPGDQATIQRFTTGANAAASTAQSLFSQSDGIIRDASYARLKNLSLSWRLPEKWLGGVQARLYMHAQNLLTITNYNGMDPETQNRDWLPTMKTFTGGFQLIL